MQQLPPEGEDGIQDGIQLEGDFHHFQLVNPEGEIPMSISVLVHVNRQPGSLVPRPALTTDDVLELHDELRNFTGDFISAFDRARPK